MPPPASPPQAHPPSPSAPPDPSLDAVSAPPPAATGWSDCPRCGEHWAPASPYCNNCGWVPGSNLADAPQTPLETLPTDPVAGQGLTPATAATLAGLAAAAAVVAVWIGVDRASAPPAAAPPAATSTAGPQAGRASATPAVATPTVATPPVAVPPVLAGASASTPAGDPARAPGSATLATLQPPAASASAPASLAASAPLAAAAPPPQPPRAAEPMHRTAQPPDLDGFARTWLAEEAAASADQLHRLRALYAERLDYRGRTGADWAVVAADKTDYLRRWPRRQYQLLALRVLEPAHDGNLRVALQVRWQLENQGRWRRGESVTVLGLRRIDGAWRIVGEAGR